MADSKHGGEIHIESWSFGSSNPARATAGDLNAPPVEGAGAAGGHVKVFDGSSGQYQPTADTFSDEDGGEVAGKDHDKWINVASATIGGHRQSSGADHEVEYDLAVPKVGDPEGASEAIGGANGGVWKTTNFGPDGETDSVGGKMHLEDVSLGATEPEAVERSAPSISEIVVTKATDSSTPGLASESPDPRPGNDMPLDLESGGDAEAMKIDGFLKVPDIPGESPSAHGAGGGGGAGKVSVHDISIMGEDDGPSSFAALTPTDEPEYLEMKLQSVKVTSYSVNGSGLDDSDDGPSSMAPLAPDDDAAERSGEQTYLAIKLENVQITSYSLNSDEAPVDLAGGTEHEDSWEEVL